MFVCNSIGFVFDITQKHIDFGDSYQYPEPYKNGFETFIWDIFGDVYDEIVVGKDRILFFKDGGIGNYLNIGENLKHWINKIVSLHKVPPIEVQVCDVVPYYKTLEMVDDLDIVFPV